MKESSTKYPHIQAYARHGEHVHASPQNGKPTLRFARKYARRWAAWRTDRGDIVSAKAIVTFVNCKTGEQIATFNV